MKDYPNLPIASAFVLHNPHNPNGLLALFDSVSRRPWFDFNEGTLKGR